MIVSGFLFCLGVVLCIWCLANLDVVIGLIWFAFIGIVFLALGGILWLGVGWALTHLDPAMDFEDAVSWGFLGAAGLAWLGLHWLNKGDAT